VPEVPGAAVVGVAPPHQLLHAVDSVAPAFLRLGSMVTKYKFPLFVGNRISPTYLPPTENMVLFANISGYFSVGDIIVRINNLLQSQCPNPEFLRENIPFKFTATKIPFSGNCVTLVPISTFMCLCAIYILLYDRGNM
jgi:hypothetical protein